MDYKTPKLRKFLSDLIRKSPDVKRGSENALLRIAETSQRPKLLKLFDMLKSKTPEKKNITLFKKQQKGIFGYAMSIPNAVIAIHNYLIDNKITKNFELVIEPAKVRSPLKKIFKHINQFEKWIKSNGEIVDSDGIVHAYGHNLGEYIRIISIKQLSGGKSIIQEKAMTFTTQTNIFKCFRPKTNNNNCIFTAIQYLYPDIQVNIKELRKLFNVSNNVKIEPDVANAIFQHLKLTDIQLFNITESITSQENIKYILLNKSHYYPVVNITKTIEKKKKIFRNLMTFDFETRETEEYTTIKETGEKMFMLKDTICSVYYRTGCDNQYKKATMNSHTFITDDETSSSRKFVDFLIDEANNNRHYNIVAHNGSRFDYYLLLASMTKKEIEQQVDMNLRGTAVIGIKFMNHSMLDSCCFLANSLSNLSKSYKVDHGKMTEFELNGVKISSTNLCFYKPELSFKDFMNLQRTEPEFWRLYDLYCVYDCMALFEIWEKFVNETNDLIKAINPFVLAKCPVMGSLTIGGHSKKILNEINKIKGKSTYDKVAMETFYMTNKEFDTDKYKFLCNFKRGGISHCNMKGNHQTGIVGFDIKSQYPTCLIYGMLPVGNSFYTTVYDTSYFGFYHYEYLYFDNTINTFRPIAEAIKDVSLNWKVESNKVNDQYIDSYMIKYLVENNGLNLSKSKLITGLVSKKEMPMNKLFGTYVNTFYNEKARQDDLKEKKSSEYNQAKRETIKLYLNSLTGKLVEDPEKYFSLSDKPVENKSGSTSTVIINGIEKFKQDNESYNEWLLTGIMVYSYSKRLLFEYINCLPNKDNSVVHIETDGIYFQAQDKQAFIDNVAKYNGSYTTVKIGSELGNIEYDKGSKVGTDNYFLGKKFYYISQPEGKEAVMRIKGIPQSTIDAYGNKIQLVDKQLYIDVFNGMIINKEFKTIKRDLESDKPKLLGYSMARDIKPDSEGYKLYV